MATVDVIKCCLDSIRQISDEIKNSIVYLDAGTTESFQFSGAFPLLMELGAQTICSLENPSSLDKVLGWNHDPCPARKIVAITSRFLSDAHRFILRCLSTLQNVHQCAIYTAMSEAAHSTDPDSPLGPDAFREYESLLTQDYEELVKKRQKVPSLSGNSELKENTVSEEGWSELTSLENEISELDGNASKNLQEDSTSSFHEGERQMLVVRVHHFPLILCPIAPRVFVLPSEGSVAEACLSTVHEDSLSSGLPPLSTGKPADIEDISPGAALTAQFLYYFALKMDLKLEIFSLGDLSKNVGKLLTDMSSLYDVGRRKRSAGILLIDRTLDLLTPCCHADSLVDRMLSSLPRGRRQTLFSQTKGSQTQSQLKNGPMKLERAPLVVQIPLESIIRKEDSKSNLQLLENIEAFLHGLNINESDDPHSVELMKPSKKMNDESCIADSGVLHGSFVSTDNFHGAPYLEAISERKTKDGAMLIKKWLQESLRRENISLNTRVRPGVPSTSELHQMIKALAKSQSSLMKNKGIIQLAAATLYSMDESHSTSWDAFISAEKVMYANAAETTQSLAAQISDLISKTALVSSLKGSSQEQSQGLFTLQGALLLTVIGYLLAGENFPTSGSGGPFSWQEEHNMKEAIVDAILENPSVSELKFLQGLSEELQTHLKRSKSAETKEDSFENPEPVGFDDEQWDNWGDDEADKDTSKEYGDLQLKLELRDRVDNLFKFLHKLSSSKRNALGREGKSIMEAQLNDDPYSRKGLLYKLLTSVLDKQDIPGMEYHSSTVGRLFKSGFGRFGLGQAKPSLADQNIILIFVIGGINGIEVREVQEALAASSKPDIDIILGGTTFLTPNDMRELLLGSYSHT